MFELDFKWVQQAELANFTIYTVYNWAEVNMIPKTCAYFTQAISLKHTLDYIHCAESFVSYQRFV